MQFCNISSVKLKETGSQRLGPHSSTSGHIPTLTLSSGTYQTHSEPVKELSSQTLNRSRDFFSFQLAQQFPVLAQLLVLVKRRGEDCTAGVEECRLRVFLKWFDFPDLVQQPASPTRKIMRAGTGITLKTRSM